MRSDRIVRDLPVLERLLERRQVELALVTLPELAPRRAVEPFDPAIELGAARRQHVERDLVILAGLLERAHELTPTVDLDRLDWDRQTGDELVQKGGGRARRRAGADADHGTAGDDVDGRELPALDAGQGAQVHRVELDQRPGLRRLAFVLGNPGGIRALGAGLPHAHGVGLAQEGACLLYTSDPANHRGAEADPLAHEEDADWLLAHARVLLP